MIKWLHNDPMHPADDAEGKDGTMPAGMCKWAATLVCGLLRHSDRQASRWCEPTCTSSSCCDRGIMKHLSDFALQAATDGLVLADVGIALAGLYITSDIGVKPQPQSTKL